MAQATYTPTHCPQTGRKFTRAERKAANKAKFALAQAGTPKRVTKRGGVTVTHFDDDANTRVYTLPSKPAKASKPKRKPAKASVLTGKPVAKATADLFRAPLMRLTKAQLVDMILGTTEDVPTPAPKRKAKASKPKATKARKATSQERTADKQERAAHGPKGVGPISPEPTAPKPDVAKARKAGKAQGERNRTKRAHKLALKWAFDGTYGGMFLPTQQAELKRLLGDVDVSTYEDVMAASL